MLELGSGADDGVTLVDRATSLIHADILAGTLVPRGAAAGPRLVERYGIGATPIREALSRLGPEGLVKAIGNRGFRVAGLTREDLEDVVQTRA